MAKKEPKAEELLGHLSGALQLYGQAQGPVLDQFAALENQRAQRLEKSQARLTAGLGESHPRVVALARAQARSALLQRGLKDNAARAAKLRELKPYEWMVYGQVVEGDGEPVAGVTVRVYDKDRKYDDLLGYTSTDQHGDFQLIYHERAFYEPGEGAPELYLRVEDADGEVLYATEDQIRYQSGRVELFVITLEKVKGKK